MIRIQEALSKKEVKQFVKFPFSLYKNSKYWVPPIISEEVKVFNKNTNPILQDADVKLFLAYKNDVIVGRIAAIVNWLEVEGQGVRKMRFGWMDMIDDIEVTKALLKAVKSLGKAQNLDYMEGPIGFSNLDKVGVLTYGYDEIGTMVTWYNHPYYVEHLKQLDFKVEKGDAKIHTPKLPLDKSYTLTFDVSDYSEEEKKQLYIANVEKPTYPMYQFTRKKDSSFFTTTKILGKYALRSDTLKPSVSLVHFKDKQWISRLNTLKVKISDKGSGIKDYRATIDGEWILMEYNHRKKIATYNFNDKKLSGSKHIFKIVVSDNVGNTNTLSATFYKKQLN